MGNTAPPNVTSSARNAGVSTLNNEPLAVGRTIAVLAIYVAFWLALRPYGGLGHDAQAYAVQALAKLMPDVYSDDLFLRYRSQDEFSIFPALHAHLIQLFGLENASAGVVLLCQISWFGAAFLLLRRLTGRTSALFGLGLLLTIRGNYGAFNIFSIAEPFLSARLPAEVLSIAGLWLLIERRFFLSVCALSVGMAIHPIMSFPAVALAICIWIAEGHRRPTVHALLVAGVLLAIIGSLIAGGTSPMMSDRWLAVSRLRSEFLFIDQWRPTDWNSCLLTLMTLALASVSLRHRHARLATGCAFGIGLAGLALAAVSSLWLELWVLIQGQPWRWMWPARLLSIGLLPAVVIALWRQSPATRAAAILLCSAWLFVAPLMSRAAIPQVLPSVLAAIACLLWSGSSRISMDQARLAQRGAWAMLAAVVASSIVTIALGFALAANRNAEFHQGFSELVAEILRFGTPAALLAVAACCLAIRAPRPIGCTLAGALAVAMLLILSPRAIDQWMARPFSGSAPASFADWRELIPVDAEVLWYDNLQETWFLLERKAYLTRSQSGGVVFSQDLAEEVTRRALVLEPYIARNFWFVTSSGGSQPNRLTKDVLVAVCRDPELSFVVSDQNNGVYRASRNWPSEKDHLYLYDCADFRKEVSE